MGRSWCLLAICSLVCCSEGLASQEEDPFAGFDFYIGTIVPVGGQPGSSIRLERAVQGKALEVLGDDRRRSQRVESIGGLVVWNPVSRRIGVSAVFAHGAHFIGEIKDPGPQACRGATPVDGALPGRPNGALPGNLDTGLRGHVRLAHRIPGGR